MAAHAPVGVDNDFPTGKSRIPFRATNHKEAGRVDEDFSLRGKQITRQMFFNQVTSQNVPNFLRRDFLGMHRRDDHRGKAIRLVVDILNTDLCFGVRTQPGVGAILTKLGQGLTEAVCIVNSSRHQLLGIIGGVTKHDALITSTLFGCMLISCCCSINTLSNIR